MKGGMKAVDIKSVCLLLEEDETSELRLSYSSLFPKPQTTCNMSQP
jgi:hypothetical protein